jgi:hypothetical protein
LLRKAPAFDILVLGEAPEHSRSPIPNGNFGLLASAFTAKSTAAPQRFN